MVLPFYIVDVIQVVGLDRSLDYIVSRLIPRINELLLVCSFDASSDFLITDDEAGLFVSRYKHYAFFHTHVQLRAISALSLRFYMLYYVLCSSKPQHATYLPLADHARRLDGRRNHGIV